MNKLTIEYRTDNNRNISKQLMAAVFEILELNHAECISFAHKEQEPGELHIPTFMCRKSQEAAG